MQSIVVYTIGIKLFVHMHDKGVGFSGDAIATFIVCVAATGVFGEIMHHLVDTPGRRFSHVFWGWLTEEKVSEVVIET